MKDLIKFLQYHIQTAPDALYEITSWLIVTEGDATYDEYVAKCQASHLDPMSPTMYIKECNLGIKNPQITNHDDWHHGDIIY